MGIYGIARLSQGANALDILSNIALGEFIGQEICLITKEINSLIIIKAAKIIKYL